MNRRLLNDAKWSCRLLRADVTVPAGLPATPLPAVVPGCIHTDLVRAGVIGHPNIADNELRTQWVGRSDWQYQCEFEVDADTLKQERVDLVFDGLDTLATVKLNGTTLGSAANQFHPHRFDTRGALREGRNLLTLDFKSPIQHIHAEAKRLGARPVNGDWDPYVFMRKSACNFGWDWGPKVATVGIIGDVKLEAWKTARIESVRPLISRRPDGSWLVRAQVRIERAARPSVAADAQDRSGAPLISNLKSEISDSQSRSPSPGISARAILRDGGKTLTERTVELAATETEVAIELEVRGVSPWMPRGHGAQRLYDLQISIEDTASSTSLDCVIRRVGFRTIALDTSPDKYGSRFQLRVNDQPIIALGANWIPEGLFSEDRTNAKIRERIRQAADANLNTLRVWGGGAYESDAFYETCDDLGILVWQDFMFACACYPEEEPIHSQVEVEARYQIARLSSHPSAALWCGGNECIWAWQGWGFDKRLQPGQTWGRGYWLDLLPRLCNELDPTRPYWPNTPWSGSLDRDVQDPNHGTRHTWDKRVDEYRDLVPRFIAEFGHQSPPNYATIIESGGADSPVQLTPLEQKALALNPKLIDVSDGAALRARLTARQRASGGDAIRYDEPMGEHFPPARDFDEWLYQAHLLQARAIAIGIEWARVHRDRCGGAIFWQLNDAWAGHSWSAIDVAGRLKPLWYGVRRACAPRLLTIQPIDGRPRLFGVNETDQHWRATVRVRRIRFDGTIQKSIDAELTVAPRDCRNMLDLTDALSLPTDAARECIIVDEAGSPSRRAVWFFERDKHLKLDSPRLQARCDVHEGAVVVSITAHTLLRDLVLAADRVLPDAIVSDQLLTLLPGESTEITLTCKSQPPHGLAAAIDALLSPAVLRCSNGPVQVERH